MPPICTEWPLHHQLQLLASSCGREGKGGMARYPPSYDKLPSTASMRAKEGGSLRNKGKVPIRGLLQLPAPMPVLAS